MRSWQATTWQSGIGRQAGKASVQHEDRQRSGHYLPVQANEQQCYVSRAVSRAGILSSNPLLFFPTPPPTLTVLSSVVNICMLHNLILSHSLSNCLFLCPSSDVAFVQGSSFGSRVSQACWLEVPCSTHSIKKGCGAGVRLHAINMYIRGASLACIGNDRGKA